jgi:hypothetical protein
MPGMNEQERIAKLITMAREEGWRNINVIDGLVCAIQPFVYTWGIVIGINEWGYERRYCYENLVDAVAAFARYNFPRYEHPTGPWIKCKGVYKGLRVDLLNPAMFTHPPAPGCDG